MRRRLLFALAFCPCLASAQTFPWDGGSLSARLADVPAPATPPSSVPTPAPDVGALFQRPLIVGASVSADFRTASPGRRAARRLGTEAAVVVRARPGATGSAIVAGLNDEDFARATVVIAVDLFFWDARRDPAAGMDAVDAFFKKADAHRTPVIIGNVPGGGELNARIAAACAARADCRLLDLDKLWAQTVADGGAVIGDKRYGLSDLRPDGLHLSEAASELVADRILALAGK